MSNGPPGRGLEDVQRLADGRAAGRRRRHAVDVEPAVGHVRRCAQRCLVGREVTELQEARAHDERAVPADRRVLDRADDVLGRACRCRARRPRDGRAGRRSSARSRLRKTDPTAGGAPRRRNRSAEDRKAENRAAFAAVWSTNVWSTTNPRRATSVAPRSAVRRSMEPHWSRAVAHVRGRAGHSDGQARRHGVGERDRHAVLDERVALHRHRRGLTTVDRVDLAGRRVVVDEEATAPDARRERLGDAERRRGRDGGVDRVPAPAQHVETDPGRVGVDRGDRPAGAGGHRHLARPCRPGVRRVRRRRARRPPPARGRRRRRAPPASRSAWTVA